MAGEKGGRGKVIIALMIILVLIASSAYVLIISQPSKDDVSGLTFYTEQFPPYNYEENGTLKGLSVELLTAITTRMGNAVTPDKIHLVPWTEGYQAVSNSTKTVLFSTFRLSEREQLFKWAGPISLDRYVLFAGRDKEITINNASDLKRYSIGVITDDAAVAQLLSIGVNSSQFVFETNVTKLVERLAHGEIDLWCYPEVVGRHITQQVTNAYYSFKVAFALNSIDCYYAFSRDVSDSLVTSFQHALDGLKSEKDAHSVSSYDRIVGRYIPSIGLAQLSYLTEEWAPFNFDQGGVPGGISVEILGSIFNHLGVNRTAEDVQIVPLADALQQARGNTGTVVFSIVRSSEREPLYKWAGPFTKSTFVVYAPLNSNITITTPSDLNKYHIGAVNATIENSLLLGQGVVPSNIVGKQVPNDLLQMLESGEIDLWATGDLTGRYEMVQAGLNPDDYGVVYLLSELDFYFAFSPDVPDMLVNSVQNAIEFVRHQPDEHGVSDYDRIIFRYLGVGYSSQPFGEDEVMAMVNQTAEAIHDNVSDAFIHINAGDPPYIDPLNPELYSFVYDANVTMVANGANPLLVGLNFQGKTDVTGKPFRDEIVTGALENGTGWVEYVYISPSQTNLYYKVTYYKLVIGSDGCSYIVCCGLYKGYG